MMNINRLKIAGLMLGFMLLNLTSSMAATKVEVNGNPIYFTVEPFQVMSRTMVPMRPIFEALGANVKWNTSTQTVIATRNETVIQLTIGETEAFVNGQSVNLEIPPMVRRGSTMVPLRFISESLGADVNWEPNTQTVTIFTNGSNNNGSNNNNNYNENYNDSNYNRPINNQPSYNTKTVLIPLGTVIPVNMDNELSSSANRVGDGFSVTINSNQDGDAEFPRGTRLVGNIVGLQRATNDQPGMLDLNFREAWLPDGSKTTINGSLISLDDESVTRTVDGRLQTKVKPTNDNRLKMIGIGAGAGLVIGKLLDKNLIAGGLLGAAAGYLYNEYSTDEVQPTDVVVKPGTVFGVRMDHDVSYTATGAFVSARKAYNNGR